jgi:hypothetical protein
VEFLDSLRKKGCGRGITGEYLSVHPEFRKEEGGISLADVLVGILMKIFVNLKIEIAIAATVRQAKVHLIGKNYGYSDQIGSYLKCGVDCLMIYNTQETYHDHPDLIVANTVNYFWDNRVDHTGLVTKPNLEVVRKAA